MIRVAGNIKTKVFVSDNFDDLEIAAKKFIARIKSEEWMYKTFQLDKDKNSYYAVVIYEV